MSEPPVGEVRAIADARQLVMPLDTYYVFSTSWNAPDRAINMLGRECMQEFGLDWPVIESTPPDVEFVDNGRRYGVIDLPQAQRYGYHLPPKEDDDWQAVQEREPTTVERGVWAGKGDETVAGRAVPEGGCAAVAMGRLKDGAPELPSVNVEQLSFESFARSENDSRVVAALAEWSTCMKGRGYTYATPSDAVAGPWFASETASDDEVATASADVECKTETNLVGVWYAVESAYQSRLVNENFQALEQLKAHYEALVRNAVSLVGAR